MSKQANKALIGAFVVGALVLAVIGVIILGSGKFLKRTVKYVMFFEGSVKGLQVGAPVTFRGVKIGEVTDIALRFNPENLSVLIPVYVEIDREKFMSSAVAKEMKPYAYYKALIEKGLKARLEIQSFVTGQLLINVDFHPDKPVRLVGLDKRYPEIPTIPTTLEELQKSIENLPLKEITEKLDSVLEGIDKIVHSPELTETFASLSQALKGVDALVRNIDGRISSLTAGLTGASEAARGAFVQAEKTFAMKEGVPGEISSGLKDTLESVRITLAKTQKAIEEVNRIAAQNVNVGYDISRSLEQITALSRSLRSLTDYLERHPEAFIKDKNPPKGE